MGKNFKLVAKTLYGFEDLLATELAGLGALHIEKGTRVVRFEGDNGMMYKANLGCRTAIKILKPIHTFLVRNEQMLYDGIKKIDWTSYLSIENTFAIDATVFSDYFNHSKYVALKSKDAIADFFVEKTKERPNVDIERPDIRINIHIAQEQCTVSLDSSGESLHQRGYRLATGQAPINEVLAAGLLMHAGWRGQSDFLDPMCGSATILIEAAMIACHIPANIHRNYFACMDWPCWDETLFEKMKEILLKKTREFAFKMNGFEINKKVLEFANQNIENAGLHEFIKLEQQDFFDSKKISEEPLFMLFNPPYDERLEVDTEIFYASIGNTLKKNYPNSHAWLITANLDALKHVGLKPSRKIMCYNGALEARLVKYEMYTGSKRTKFQEKDK
ncbi:MAG: THUMP domain-containing protein [Chitinophagaceae bacterium]